MLANPDVFRNLAYVFVAALVGGMLAWRLRQPIIIGYVLAGILISPLTPGPSVTDLHTLDLLAEIGVILLMFSVGLEFSVKELLREKWVALLGGPAGILLLIGMSLGTGYLLGWTVTQGLVVGAAVCVASTMVLTRLLQDHGQLRTRAGRIMIAITLVEDLAVVVLIVLVPALGQLKATQFWILAKDLGLAVLILVPALFIAVKVVPPVLKQVAQTQRRELFFLVVLAICLGIAALTQAVGLSLALGAFIAGLIVSESEYAHEALAQLFSLRDAFVALFFVTIGLLVDPRTLFSNIPIVVTMIAIVVIGKFAVWTAMVRIFGYPILTAATVGIGLTQIGEFSFVLVQVARNAGIVGNDIYNATLATSLITIALNAALVRYVPPALARKHLSAQLSAPSQTNLTGGPLRNHVLLCGFGRIGSAIGTALEAFGVQYTAVDIDPDINKALRARGVSSIFGDPAHPHILEQANINTASLMIVTVPDPDSARLAISNARRMNPSIPIIGRAHQRRDHEILVRAGATEVIRPEMEASATMIRHASAYLHLPDEHIRAYLRGFRQAMESLQRKPEVSRIPLMESRELTLTNSPIIGQSLRSSRIRERFGVTVISIVRVNGESLLNPPADTYLKQGDTLRVLGLAEQLDAFNESALRAS